MIPDSEAIIEQFGSQARYNDHRVTVDMVTVAMVTVAKIHSCFLNHTTNENCKNAWKIRPIHYTQAKTQRIISCPLFEIEY